jgi:hypothetical protein
MRKFRVICHKQLALIGSTMPQIYTEQIVNCMDDEKNSFEIPVQDGFKLIAITELLPEETILKQKKYEN